MKQYSLNKFKENKKMKKKIKATITIISVAFIIIVSALYIANSSFRKFVDIKILRKEILESDAVQLKIDAQELSYVGVVNNKVVTINGGVLTFYSDKGREEDKLDVILSNPISDTENKYLILGDKGGNKLYLINDKTIKWEKEIEGKISKVSVSKSGYVSVVITGTTYESIVAVYDNNGNNLFNHYLSRTYVIDSDISKDEKYIAIGEIDYTGASPKSKVKILSIDNAQNNKDKAIVYTYNGENGDIITDLNYQEKDRVLCMFDSYVLSVTPKGHNKVYEINDNTLFTDVNLKNQYVKIEKESAKIFKSEYRMKISEVDKKKEKLYALEGNVKMLKTSDNMIAIVSSTNIEFVKKNGWLSKKYVGSKEIKDLCISDKIAAIIYKDRIDIVTF